MPKCNVCKTIYGDKQRQFMLQNETYCCAFCCSVYKIFNPLPAEYFYPEKNIDEVLNNQKKRYEFGKSTGWYKN